MRAAGDQTKTVRGNLQLCANLEASIEGAKHDVWKWRVNRVRVRRSVEEEVNASDKEEESGGVAAALNI